MNLYRMDKTGCPHITDRFSYCCKEKSYSIQMNEVLSGNGHDENVIVYENIRRIRLGGEDFWMKKLRTRFLHGLSKISKDLISETLNRYKFWRFMKTTENRPTCHLHLPIDPPTIYPPNFVKTEDQILNIFCIL